jgi:DNA-directed RNA polymerase specialized sigma24 family protein
MNTHPRKMPSWLPDLVQQVEATLQSLSAAEHDQRPAWEQELREIQENAQGWSLTLAKKSLPVALRETIEEQWAAALERQQEIEALLAQAEQQGRRAERLVEPEQVTGRLDRLDHVLAAHDPTRGNLELSLHIDRITGFRDGCVRLRMCKLGILPDAVELLAKPVMKPTENETTKPTASRTRRRGKLRVIEDDAEVDLRAQADFVADVDRFAGLGDEWFWIDEFTVPESSSWAKENAEQVFLRRQAERLSFAKLAEEFGVTPPTIGAAVRAYLEKHPDESDIELGRGGKRKPKFDLAAIADAARQRWIDGESKEQIAKKYGCSAPTVGKAIAFAYEREGLKMPTRAEARRVKFAEARRLLDEEKSLDEIAVALGVSDVTARGYLQESFAAEGKTMPDLRRRKRA